MNKLEELFRDKPEEFVSDTDKMFDEFMDSLEKSEKSTDVSWSVKPLFNEDDEMDGAMLSFSKKF